MIGSPDRLIPDYRPLVVCRTNEHRISPALVDTQALFHDTPLGQVLSESIRCERR